MSKIGLFAFALLISINVFSQNVEIEEAKKIAENYLLMQPINAAKDVLTISESFTTRSESGEVLYYIFNFESGGFVIVSGDKRANPILAFSTTNTFLVDKNHPAYVFVDGYEKGIEYIKTMAANTDISPRWNDIAAKKQHKAIVAEVGPLLTSVWNQDKYYNTLCPDDNTGTDAKGCDYRVPNGCVALAMAQIMYYHRFPRVGKGSSSYPSNYGLLSADYGKTTYDYESMADQAIGYSDALARLIYHAGVSINMQYGPDGSSGNDPNVRTALPRYFLYKNSMKLIYGGDYPSNTYTWWNDTIRQNLDKKLPVYYSACRTPVNPNDRDACHAFVCDGYRIDDAAPDMFHFNFGWGGYNDGFYTLSTMQGFYKTSSIIIDIEPSNDTINFFTGQKVLTATYGSFNDGSGRFNYRDNTDCSWLISPQNGRNISSITLTVASFSLAAGDTVKIYKGRTMSVASLVAVLTDTILSQNSSYVINASEALVTFTSDSSINEEGFTFNYTTTKTSSNYCPTSDAPTRITAAKGSIDNGSGGAFYDSDNACHWAIAPAGMGNTIRFAFSKFDLAKGDVIEVIKHPLVNLAATHWETFYTRGAYRFSIDNKPFLDSMYSVTIQPASGTETTLLFRFRTDNNLEGTGFRIYWDSTIVTSVQDYNGLGLANLSIYPNPANNVINVDLYADKEESIQINLYDILGRNLYSAATQQVLGQYQERISVGDYAKGLYMLRISTSKGTVVRKVAVE